MKIPRKRCRICHQWFSPHPRTATLQKTCSRDSCQKKRRCLTNQHWRMRHPDYDHSRPHKIRAWAKTYPNYWSHYRATHPDYVARDNRRRRSSQKERRCSAKQDAIRQIAVGKLQSIPAVATETSAKQDPILRRLNGVVEYLLWKEMSANQDVIASPVFST